VENSLTVLLTPALPKFATVVVDTSGTTSLDNIFVNFRKIEMTLLLFSGAWGKIIDEKNLKQKIS
jgi:hypothetical protein